MPPISREACIEQSVEDFIRDAVTLAGFPMDQVQFVDAFDDTFEGSLDHEVVAMGLAYDPGGDQGELGSSLRIRTYVLECTIYGRSLKHASTLCYAIGHALDASGLIDLKDLRDPARPVIDRLQVEEVRRERVEIDAPKPYERWSWMLTVPVTDVYYSSSW